MSADVETWSRTEGAMIWQTRYRFRRRLTSSMSFTKAMVNAFFISDSEYCFSQLAFPPPAGLRKVRHVQRCHVLRVSGAFDVLICGFVKEREESYAYVTDVLDNAIVHDCVPAEDEGVVVDRRDGRGGGGADVGEQSGGAGVGADAMEDEVVRWGH